jgi:hypothetical protein
MVGEDSEPDVTISTAYDGFSMVRKCIRARYSPKIPSANSCTPEKIAITEARNGKPGTLLPRTK